MMNMWWMKGRSGERQDSVICGSEVERIRLILERIGIFQSWELSCSGPMF